MLEIGWTELLLIGIVALIVVGPKDLPMMFRQLGRFAAKIRAMGRDFSRAMEQAADETGVKDMARDIKAATNLRQTGMDALKDAATKFEAWDPKRTSPTAMAGKADKAADAAAPAADAAPATPEVAAATANRGPYTAALARAQEARRAELAATAAAARTGTAITAPAAAAPAPDRTPDTTGEG